MLDVPMLFSLCIQPEIIFVKEVVQSMLPPSIKVKHLTASHHKLFDSLLKTGFPVCLLSLLMNWYSKLNVAVRWKGFLSFKFKCHHLWTSFNLDIY